MYKVSSTNACGCNGVTLVNRITPKLAYGGKLSDSLSTSKEIPKRFQEWNLSQALYATMGGFAVDSTSFWRQSRITFTPAGILELAQLGILPCVSAEDIEDKSKADTLAKFIVVLHATWFLVQAVARTVSGLPLTLLEIHTVAHVICTFVIYGLWFQKPYNVNRPTLFQDDRIIDLAALFALNRREFYCDRQILSCSSKDELVLQDVSPTDVQSNTLLELLPCLRRKSRDTRTLLHKSNHLKRANRAIHHMRAKGSHFQWSHSPIDHGPSYKKCYAVFNRKNHKIDGKADQEEKQEFDDEPRNFPTTAQWTFSLVGAGYAALHLIAWNAHFPSILEMWFWRVAALSLVIAPWVLVMPALCKKLDYWVWGERIGISAGPSKGLTIRTLVSKACRGLLAGVKLVAKVLAVLALPLYPWVRMYFIVEAVLGLRAPPVGAYESVEWTGFIPHFS